MKKEKFFKELENKIRKANCMSDREKNSELKIIEELKNINSDNVDDYIDIINSFSIDDCYHFWEWLKTVTKYTEEDFQRYLSLNSQKYTTTRFYYPHGIEGESMKTTVKEFDTLEKAIKYAQRYAKGIRFAGLWIENQSLELVYEITSDFEEIDHTDNPIKIYQ